MVCAIYGMVCVKSVENLIRPREKKGVRTMVYLH